MTSVLGSSAAPVAPVAAAPSQIGKQSSLAADLSSWESSSATSSFLNLKKPEAAMNQESSYKKSINFDGMYAGSPPKKEDSNALTSFDWGPMKQVSATDAHAYGMLQ